MDKLKIISELTNYNISEDLKLKLISILLTESELKVIEELMNCEITQDLKLKLISMLLGKSENKIDSNTEATEATKTKETKLNGNSDVYFYIWYEKWVEDFKKGTVREVTLRKYKQTCKMIRMLAPNLKLKELTRAEYQRILNIYGETHEKQTTLDFHRQLKCGIQDALHDGLLEKDPTYKVTIKGKPLGEKKEKYLSYNEWCALLNVLNLPPDRVNKDWFIYLIAKTGMRFSECLGLTPSDFNFDKQTVDINKTWNYKDGGYFDLTKNEGSIRTILIDDNICKDFKTLLKEVPHNEPFFVMRAFNGRAFNSTINDLLSKRCDEAGITVITVHGLRHTHASISAYMGIDIKSIAKRLGHVNTNTTLKVYSHLISELEERDNKKLMEELNKI